MAQVVTYMFLIKKDCMIYSFNQNIFITDHRGSIFLRKKSHIAKNGLLKTSSVSRDMVDNQSNYVIYIDISQFILGREEERYFW